MKKGRIRGIAALSQDTRGTMAYCGEHTAVKSEEGRRTGITLRCRAWTCPDCADTRKAGLIAQGIGGNPTKFLTLTMRRVEGEADADAAKRLSRAWRLVRLRLMRHYKLPKLPFLAIMEKHVSGWPHLHLLLRAPWLSQKLISEWMAEICDGPIVWIEHLDKSHKAVIYCAKYCGKCAEKFSTAKRYWQSRDYDQRPDSQKHRARAQQGGWDRQRDPLYQLIHHWRRNGWTVEQPSKWKAIATLAHGGLDPP